MGLIKRHKIEIEVKTDVTPRSGFVLDLKSQQNNECRASGAQILGLHDAGAFKYDSGSTGAAKRRPNDFHFNWLKQIDKHRFLGVWAWRQRLQAWDDKLGILKNKLEFKTKNFLVRGRSIFNRDRQRLSSFKEATINYYREELNNVKNISSEAIKLAGEREGKKQKQKAGRLVLILIGLMLLVVLPIKILTYYRLWQNQTSIKNNGEAAVNDLSSALMSAGNLQLNGSSANFAAAEAKFFAAQNDLRALDELTTALARLSRNPQAKLAVSAPQIMAVGASASTLGSDLSSAIAALLPFKADNLSAQINDFVLKGNLAINDSKILQKQLAEIDPSSLPDKYRDQFSNLKSQFNLFGDSLENFVDLASGLNNFLGASGSKRYLLVFQNNSELRASGGFIGSYALIDFKAGRLSNIEVPAGGAYDTRYGLRVSVAPPKPMLLVTPPWHFWDANWWPDFKLSAENLAWFYENSGGSSVDGIISLTPTVLEDLLKVTGPIDMTKDYGLVITSDNFWEVTEGWVEKAGNPTAYASSSSAGQKLAGDLQNNSKLASTKTYEPKKIIGDLMNRILEELPKRMSQDKILQLSSLMVDDLQSKQILFYFKDPDLQNKIEANSWAGRIKDAPIDYLQVVDTNIHGAKTDRVIDQKINQVIDIDNNGQAVETLTIVRRHNGVLGQPFVGVNNINWLRVYTPLHSRLLSASGFSVPTSTPFNTSSPTWQNNELVALAESQTKIDPSSGLEIYPESDKTVFAGWSQIEPGATATITLKYALPEKLPRLASQGFWGKLSDFFFGKSSPFFKYSLLTQKQAGAKAGDYQINLNLPTDQKIFWKYPENSVIMESAWSASSTLKSDEFYSLLIGPKLAP